MSISNDYQIFCCRYPWNVKTPFGYLVSSLLQSVSVFYTAAVNQTPVLYHMEICAFLNCFIWDMEKHLEELNKRITQKSIKLTPIQRAMARQNFCNIMRFDAKVRELSTFFSNTYISIFT